MKTPLELTKVWGQQENHKLSMVQVKEGRDRGDRRANSVTLKMPVWIKFCRGWRCVVSILQKPGEPQLGSLPLQSWWGIRWGWESQAQGNAQAAVVHVNVLGKSWSASCIWHVGQSQ